MDLSKFKSSRISWKLKGIAGSSRLSKEIELIDDFFRELEPVTDFHGKNVVLFTSIALFTDHVIVEYALASHLRALGASVTFVFCERNVDVCHAHDRYSCGIPVELNKAKSVCNACVSNQNILKKKSKFPIINFDSPIPAVHSELKLEIDEHINAAVVRYLATSARNTDGIDVVKSEYSKSASTFANGIQHILNSGKPDLVIAHHGIYVPQGIVNDLCSIHKIPFYSWHFGYRKSTIIFSYGNTYHKELIEDPADFVMTNLDVAKIDNYLLSRRTGSSDWIHFNRNPTPFSLQNSSRKKVCFFTSVDWDAVLHFKSSVYNSQFDFVDDYVLLANENADIDFYIRVHPAEVTGFHPSSVSIAKYINERHSKLPKNLFLIPASEPTSSYEIADLMDVCFVYNTKLAIELTCSGKKTIVAGDAWVRGRGYTWDVDRSDELSFVFKRCIKGDMTADQIRLAKKFAYYFYFKRCMDVPEFVKRGRRFSISFDNNVNLDTSGLRRISRKLLSLEPVVFQ